MGWRMNRGRRTAGLTLAIVALACAQIASGGEPGEVAGRIDLEPAAANLAALRPVVIFLEAVGEAPGFEVPHEIPSIRQKNATFSPTFLVIAAGQTVNMPNDDWIYHNVFSYSKPNDFDLGLYAKGETRKVTFRYPGVVHIYCSIHESMAAVIFISPTPWFTIASDSGEFRIPDVPPGRYRLRTWNERLPSREQMIAVSPGRPAFANLAIGADG